MRVVRVQHVSVNCHGHLEETRRFYADLFGLAATERPDIADIGGRWLTLGDAQLHLVDAAPLGTAIDPVADHWCIEVDDIDHAREELVAAGIDYLEGAQGTVVQLWLRDPTGRTIELQQAR